MNNDIKKKIEAIKEAYDQAYASEKYHYKNWKFFKKIRLHLEKDLEEALKEGGETLKQNT